MASQTLAIPSTSNLTNSGSGTTSWTIGTYNGGPGGDAFIQSAQVNKSTTTLVGSSYGFSLPVNATVQGIQLTFDLAVFAFGPLNGQVNLNGATLKAQSFPVTSGGTYVYGNNSFGGSSDLWGRSWSYSDINSSAFSSTLWFGVHSDIVVRAANFTITVTYLDPITNRDQTGTTRVTQTVLKTQTAIGRVQTTVSKDETGLSRLQKTIIQDQSGAFRISSFPNRDQLGKTAIFKTVTRGQDGKAFLVYTSQKNQLGVSNLATATNRNQLGTARMVKGQNFQESPLFFIKPGSPDVTLVPDGKPWLN